MNKTRRIQPLPFNVYFLPVLLLALAGFFDSIYLSYAHHRVYTDISYDSFCAISKAINCDTVSQSPYAVFLNIPVPIWGVIGYLFLVILILFAGFDKSRDKSGWTLLMVISAFYSIYSIILAMISNYLIHSYCIMCIVSYVINFAVLFYCWLIRRRFSVDRFWRGLVSDFVFFMALPRHQTILSVFGLSALLVIFLLPPYWVIAPEHLNKDLPHGLTETGHPWIGAENPELTITEYSDYLCFQCRKMHYYLREMVEAYPDKIRLVHRHFPFDNQFNPIVKDPFHVGSGKMALMAIYAGKKEKFWEMNDLLFSIPRGAMPLVEIAEKSGLDARELAWALKSQLLKALLANDIHDALQLGLTATPGFVIEDEVYVGNIPPEIINSIIE